MILWKESGSSLDKLSHIRKKGKQQPTSKNNILFKTTFKKSSLVKKAFRFGKNSLIKKIDTLQLEIGEGK